MIAMRILSALFHLDSTHWLARKQKARIGAGE
jgi:hypothetical protein